tara:strand:- start:229 stop:402 length:174 start_codon:yes stop_codon:yes gene_type:complete
MPRKIEEEKILDHETYLDFDSEVLRDSIKTLYDNCRVLQSRIEELESKVEQLEIDND